MEAAVVQLKRQHSTYEQAQSRVATLSMITDSAFTMSREHGGMGQCARHCRPRGVLP